MTTITAERMTSRCTRHWAEPTVAGQEYGTWSVSWLPGRELDRDKAITAMTLAEFAGSGVTSSAHERWPFMRGWAAELGLTADDAVARILRENVSADAGDTDLFGNTVQAAQQSTPERPPPVNDMALIQKVLRAVTAPGYHLHGVRLKVYRCDDVDLEPVPAYEDAAVHQLIDAKYIEVTSPRACPFATRVADHGLALRLTKRGKDAHHRWSAYKPLPR